MYANPVMLACVLLALLTRQVVECGKCGPCACTVGETGSVEVNCSDKDLTSVPNDLPKSTRVLDLSRNRLAPENLNGLCHFALKRVNLTGNHLTSLSSNQFERCFITGQIDFRGNVFDSVFEDSMKGLQDVRTIFGLESRNFLPTALSALISVRELSIVIHQTNLSSELFSSLRRIETLTVDIRNGYQIPGGLFRTVCNTLKKLILITTSLPFIEHDILAGCTRLEVFEIVGRSLHSVPATLFEQTPALTNISMSGIGSLPRNVFRNLDQLTTLEIHGVEDMPSDVFVDRIELKHLDLSSCSIAKIPHGWFNDLWSLETLNLANVGLKAMDSEDFIGLHSLKDLELSNNIIRFLVQSPFQKLNSTIKYIGLSQNVMKTIETDAFTDLTQLTKIDLSSNKIHTLSTKAFSSLKALKTLLLNDNKIYMLPEDVFDKNSNLEVLDLSSNVISQTNPETFTDLHALSVLKLSDNNINALPKIGKSSNSSMLVLDLSFNHQLQCECVSPETKAILSNVQILGSCSNANVLLQDYIKSSECLPNSSSPTPIVLTATHRFSPPVDYTVKSNYTTDGNVYKKDNTSELTNRNESSANVHDITANNSTPSFSSSPSSVAATVTALPWNSSESNTDASLNTENTSTNESTLIVQDITARNSTPSLNIGPTSVPATVTYFPRNESKSNTDAAFNPDKTGQNESSLNLHDITEQNSTASLSSNSSSDLNTDASLNTENTTTIESSVSVQDKTANNSTSSLISNPTSVPATATDSRQDSNQNIQTTPIYDTEDIVRSLNISSDNSDGTSSNISETTELSKNHSNNTLNGTIKFDKGITETAYAFEKAKPTSESHYIAVVAITTVSILAVGFLVYLWYRRSRTQRGYEVSNIDNQEMDDFITGPIRQQETGSQKNAVPLKDVPSIQIETVDDQDRVHVVEYPTSQTKA